MVPSNKLLFALVIFCGVLSCLAFDPFNHKYDDPITAPDQCNQWPNCTACLANKFCGWCSTPVVYQNGGPSGFQCAGFNPDNDTNPWTCYGTYSTEKCLVGYNCSAAKQQCVLTDPGNGLPLDQCNASCFPKFYSCSPVNATCVETDQSHGGIPMDVCQAQCKAQNNTPTDLVGIWRGLEISAGYMKGEWQLVLANTNATLYEPNLGLVWEGNVSSVQNYVIVTLTTGSSAGLRIYVLYQTEVGPVTKWATIAAGHPGAPPPVAFDDAMTSSSAEEYVFVSCLDPTNCKFVLETDWEAAHPKKASWGAIPEKKARIIEADPPIDHCSVFENCTSCLDSPFCGWCSTNVIYEGNILGSQCAGFNPNTTDLPFVCVGSYSIVKCPLPEPTYECNATTKTCSISKTGSPESICNATCGKNSSTILYKCNVANMTCEPDNGGQSFDTCNSTCQLQPFPVDLNGVYRGLEVSQNYTYGEYRLAISSYNNTVSNFNLTDPRNITLSGYMDHIASEAVLRVHITSPVTADQYSLYQIAYGPETSYLTLANGVAGSDEYPSFVQAMTGDGMSELNFIQCLNPTLCKFP